MGDRLLRRIAARVLGPEKAGRVWSRLDIVGDIAVVKAAPGSLSVEELRMIAEELLRELPYVRSVWLAASPVRGSHKVRRLVHLAGEERTETVYVEHGCRFKVDIARVFVTPRLNYEHARVAGLVRPGEVVVNMFAGAGLFSVIIACKARPRRVYSIDINPAAYEYMKVNARLNRVEDVVVPILGDAAEVVSSRLRGVADRVLMPLPDLALEYLPHAVGALRGRGVIHVYLHVRAPKGSDPLALSTGMVSSRLDHLGVLYRIAGVRRVRPVGPRTLQTVVDVVVDGG